MAFRITTNILLLTDNYVPARELFERVRCTVFGLRLPFYSLPIKSVGETIFSLFILSINLNMTKLKNQQRLKKKAVIFFRTLRFVYVLLTRYLIC
jgi:hypothetical protein